MAEDSKPKLLYILAQSYSGSTLLTMLLARHTEIATVGELNFKGERQNMETYRCSCGELLRTCSFWNQVSQIAAGRGVDFSVDHFDTAIRSRNPVSDRLFRATYKNKHFTAIRSALISLVPGAANELRARVKRIYEIGRAICTVEDGEIFLDGSKHAIRLYYFLRSNLWNVKVIYLTRDGRGVTCSSMSNRSVEFADAMKQWKAMTKELHNFRATLPADSVIDVKYEDLCRDPNGELSRILTQFKIPKFDALDTGIQTDEQHIIGNRMRLTFQSDIRLDERWKTDLSRAQLEIFERQAGTLNRSLGYSRPRV